jgi:hypothetical protein
VAAPPNSEAATLEIPNHGSTDPIRSTSRTTRRKDRLGLGHTPNTSATGECEKRSSELCRVVVWPESALHLATATGQ